MEELQTENENLSNTVRELTERLMLHEEDSDDDNPQEEHVFARKSLYLFRFLFVCRFMFEIKKELLVRRTT